MSQQELQTTIGNGSAVVFVEYEVDFDTALCFDHASGREYETQVPVIELGPVMFNGTVINDVLTDDQLKAIEMDCQAHFIDTCKLEYAE